MVIRTYFDKNNTIVYNSTINTGLNPVTELFYGGSPDQKYSRFLLYFDEKRIRELYYDGTFADITKLKHTLRMTNCSSLDNSLLNGYMENKKRTSSFDLLLFKINEPWDNGVGYDYVTSNFDSGNNSVSSIPSNWKNPRIGYDWEKGLGVYSGSPGDIIIATQHFDKGNEDIEFDITEYVNCFLIDDSLNNYGLGIAFHRGFEEMESDEIQYVGFFTNNTQSFYEPYVETIYSNHIRDHRSDFFLDKYNKLYLYVNVGGNPVNLDSIPKVEILDNKGNVTDRFVNNEIKHITKGVYCIEVKIATNETNLNTMYHDIWSDIVINGIKRPNITMDFIAKDSMGYYNLGDRDSPDNGVSLSVYGILNNEKIKRGDIRKLTVSARIPYTVEQEQKISDLKYRLYVKEGISELTVIDFQPVEMSNNNIYFLIDTDSLIPMTYYLDLLVTSNLQVTTFKESLRFIIVNQVELKNY